MPTLDQELRDAIVKLVPEIDDGEQVTSRGSEIRLSDVLRAIETVMLPFTVAIDQNGWFWSNEKGISPELQPTGVEWNLTLSSLEDQ